MKAINFKNPEKPTANERVIEQQQLGREKEACYRELLQWYEGVRKANGAA